MRGRPRRRRSARRSRRSAASWSPGSNDASATTRPSASVSMSCSHTISLGPTGTAAGRPVGRISARRSPRVASSSPVRCEMRQLREQRRGPRSATRPDPDSRWRERLAVGAAELRREQRAPRRPNRAPPCAARRWSWPRVAALAKRGASRDPRPVSASKRASVSASRSTSNELGAGHTSVVAEDEGWQNCTFEMRRRSSLDAGPDKADEQRVRHAVPARRRRGASMRSTASTASAGRADTPRHRGRREIRRGGGRRSSARARSRRRSRRGRAHRETPPRPAPWPRRDCPAGRSASCSARARTAERRHRRGARGRRTRCDCSRPCPSTSDEQERLALGGALSPAPRSRLRSPRPARRTRDSVSPSVASNDVRVHEVRRREERAERREDLVMAVAVAGRVVDDAALADLRGEGVDVARGDGRIEARGVLGGGVRPHATGARRRTRCGAGRRVRRSPARGARARRGRWRPSPPRDRPRAPLRRPLPPRGRRRAARRSSARRASAWSSSASVAAATSTAARAMLDRGRRARRAAPAPRRARRATRSPPAGRRRQALRSRRLSASASAPVVPGRGARCRADAAALRRVDAEALLAEPLVRGPQEALGGAGVALEQLDQSGEEVGLEQAMGDAELLDQAARRRDHAARRVGAPAQRLEHRLAAQRHGLDGRRTLGDAEHAHDVEAAAAGARDRARAPQRRQRRAGQHRVGAPPIAGAARVQRAPCRAPLRWRRSRRAAPAPCAWTACAFASPAASPAAISTAAAAATASAVARSACGSVSTAS